MVREGRNQQPQSKAAVPVSRRAQKGAQGCIFYSGSPTRIQTPKAAEHPRMVPKIACSASCVSRVLVGLRAAPIKRLASCEASEAELPPPHGVEKRDGRVNSYAVESGKPK